MMRTLVHRSIAALLLLGLAPGAVAATIATPFDADNFNDGIMFDVAVADAPVTVTALNILADFGTFDYEVYYRAGGIAGEVGNSGAWTLLDRFDALTTAGADSLTGFDVTDLTLDAGSLYGFYVTDSQGAFSVLFNSDSDPIGSVRAEDAALAIRSGYSVEYPFGTATPGRGVVGSIEYVLAAVPEPQGWATMIAGFGVIGGAMRRQRTRPMAIA